MPKTSKPPLWRRPCCERRRVNFRLGSIEGFGEARRIRLWHVADDVRIESKVRYRGPVRGTTPQLSDRLRVGFRMPAGRGRLKRERDRRPKASDEGTRGKALST
jgi:hypothetical protein